MQIIKLIAINLEGEISVQLIIEDENGCQSKPDLMNVLVTNSTGINSVNKNTLNIYPNPAINEFYVNAIDGEYEIFDALGKQVMQGKILSENHLININSLVNGIYFITLKNSTGNYGKKIVVEK